MDQGPLTPPPAPSRWSAPVTGRGLALALAAGLVLFVTANLVALRLLDGVRLDLTEDRLYTLSPETREVLSLIDEPVHLRLFYSEAVAETASALATYARRVRELLAEYDQAAGPNLIIEVLDPAPFTEAEDLAVSLGIPGIPLPGTGEAVYFGLAGTNAVDDTEIIAFLQPDREPELEHDLTRMILRLATPEPPTVGLITPETLPIAGGLSPFGQQLESFVVADRVRDLFNLRTLSGSIPDDIDILWLVHPRELDPALLAQIDQWALAGKPLLVFADPNSEAETLRRPRQEFAAPNFSDLGPFADAWGVRVVPDRVAVDATRPMQVNAGTATRPDILPYLAWFSVVGERINRDNPITADLAEVIFGSPGQIEAVEGAGSTVTPLITASAQSMTVDAAQIRQAPDPRQLLADFQADAAPPVLAARVTGRAVTAVPEPADANGDAAPRLADTEDLNVVLVADTDMLDDRFWVEIQASRGGTRIAAPFADNGDLVIGAIETLSGGVSLSGLRGRGVADRPFTLIEDLTRAADQRFRATELALLERLQAAEDRLRAVADGEEQTQDAAEARDELRRQILDTRAELRQVQLALREDVEDLRQTLTWLNVAGVPTLVALAAIGLALARQARRRRFARSPIEEPVTP